MQHQQAYFFKFPIFLRKGIRGNDYDNKERFWSLTALQLFSLNLNQIQIAIFLPEMNKDRQTVKKN